MFKVNCPCCKKKTLSFYNFTEQLISTSILWDGYKCSSCNRDLLSLHVRIGSYIFHITFFLVLNLVINDYIIPFQKNIAMGLAYTMLFGCLYAIIISFVTFLFAIVKCDNFGNE